MGTATQPPEFLIGTRRVGEAYPPLVIAEVGINHEGDVAKAKRMVDDAVRAGCECIKFQSHSVDDEMIPNDVVPANASESIWDIIARCSLTAEEERELKRYTEAQGLIFLSTPFSREAASRLNDLDVPAFKIGSGECNNYPLIDHIAAFGKPVILSTGMNTLSSIARAVDVIRAHGVPFALLHCTSLYPTPYEDVRLEAMHELRDAFPDAVIGLSDHTPTIYPALGAVALGASILERHFVSDRSWPGPDVPISMTPDELRQLIEGSRAIHQARRGGKDILEAEQPTIRFAYASVVALRDIEAGEMLDTDAIWVKRPGTGEILAPELDSVIGRRAARPIARNQQLRWTDVEP